MKIMILAIGRSGTTALLYKVGAALPDSRIFSGGKPDKVAGFNGNGVFKFTYNEPKGRTFDMFREHLRQRNTTARSGLPVIPGILSSVECFIGGTRDTGAEKSNTWLILTWF